MSRTPLQGIFTALLTPFTQNQVDEEAFARLVEWQIAQGVHGLVPCGTTGESPTLSHAEHKRLIEICVETAAGRVPVVAGAGSNATAEAIDLTLHAQRAGADYALTIAPYYNKPNQEGLFQHFKMIHDAVDIPLVIYNVPGRCVVNVSDDTLVRLSKLERVVALKDATGDLARVPSLRHRIGDRLSLLSGEDMTMVGFNAEGGQGCISVTSNIAPALCAEIQRATLDGDYVKARQLQEKLVPLHDAMFLETSPIPVKYAASLLGYCDGSLRLPLVEATRNTQSAVRSAMQTLHLL